jgi:deoxyadenosine/deoxycytidine kinase
MEVIFWLCIYTIGFLLTLSFIYAGSIDFDDECDWQTFLILFIIWPLFISMCTIVILILLICSIPEMYRRIKHKIKRKYEKKRKENNRNFTKEY